jgi:hypothetical protein
MTEVLNTFYFLSLFQFLVVKLAFTHWNLVTLEVFYSEANSTEFNSVKFLNLVIVFSSFIFEWAGNKPEAVNALLFLVDGWSSVVEVVAIVVFFKEAEATSVGVLCRVDNIIWLVEIDLIVVANNLPLWLCLQTHLDDVPGLIVEKSVRVTDHTNTPSQQAPDGGQTAGQDAIALQNNPA